MARRLSPALFALILLPACAVGPDYRPPEHAGPAPVDAAFANAGATGLAAGALPLQFWSAFKDPQLDRLVADSLAANHSLQAALANLRAARGGLRLQGSDRFPTITAGADWQYGRQSETQAPGLTRDQRTGDVADAGFDAVWELDFFGRVRRGVEAAQAEAQQAEASLADVQVSLSAEVARNYLELRGLQERLAVALGNADNQAQTLKITRARLDAGRGNELDTSRAEAQWQTTLASVPLIESEISARIHRLSVLSGRQPSALATALGLARPSPALPALTPVGTPEELLRRRPDIRVAERQLAAATARIGLAVGDLFPKLSFVGAIGYNAASLDDLGSGGSQRYGFGPSISWAAFDIGRVRSRIAIAEARSDAAFANYQSTVLGALEETESALVLYGRSQLRHERLALAAAASTRAARLARERFEAGLTDFVNVLEAERDALQAQDERVRSSTQSATALIAVYKALGGGWPPAPP